jgi:pimeloyl-ACP methyl ester carboxylesterase
MRKLPLIVATTSLLVATMSTSAAASPSDRDESRYPSRSITWGPCKSERLTKAGAVCGMLSVPLDYDDHHNKERIEISLSMIKHTVPEDQYQGIMLANPGGPGGSGLGLSRLGGFVPNNAGAAYDWIGFDPRGVGSSKPALTCNPDITKGPRPDFVPSTPEVEKELLARAEKYADDCAKNAGPLLDHLKTIDNARDMDQIRRAMGQRKLSFYGFSYGTYLGQVYATTFPKRVKRMVLDSNVDARTIWYTSNLEQNVAFEGVFKEYYKWIASYDDVYKLGKTADEVEKLFYATQDKLRANPAGGVVGPDEWTDVITGAGYNQGAWPGTAALISEWVTTQDPKNIVAAYVDASSPDSDNGYAMYLATICSEGEWPSDWDTWREDNIKTAKEAPFLTWGNAWFNAPCRTWHAEPGELVEIDGRRVAPILLLGETLDGATPYEGSLEVRRRFPKASLISSPGGTTHANSLSGFPCVDGAVADYLATGKLPARQEADKADAECAAPPLPVPDPPAAPAPAPAPDPAPAPAPPAPAPAMSRQQALSRL